MLYVNNYETWNLLIFFAITMIIIAIIIHIIMCYVTVKDIVIVINIKVQIKHFGSNCYHPAVPYLVIFMAELSMVW